VTGFTTTTRHLRRWHGMANVYNIEGIQECCLANPHPKPIRVLVPSGFVKPLTRSRENPCLYVRVRVFTGTVIRLSCAQWRTTTYKCAWNDQKGSGINITETDMLERHQQRVSGWKRRRTMKRAKRCKSAKDNKEAVYGKCRWRRAL
jgi:hypothetical protein